MTKPAISITLKNEAELTKNFNLFGGQIKKVVHDLMDVTFNEMVTFAKTNAVWTDRTGNARNSITSEDLSSGDVVKFYLTIGVDYGIWLELANDGKYRILQPTLTIYEPRIMKLLESVGVALTNGRMITHRSFK